MLLAAEKSAASEGSLGLSVAFAEAVEVPLNWLLRSAYCDCSREIWSLRSLALWAVSVTMPKEGEE